MMLSAEKSVGSFFTMATSQSTDLPETLTTAYNPGMRLLELPASCLWGGKTLFCKMKSGQIVAGDRK